jgi:AcrR family transcriptional regulator
MTTSERRKYESPVRRQRAAETRERILAAGSELVHGLSSWDWRELTVRAVAKQAGVNERTVYRHFSSERELHDAVIGRLQEEAGNPLDGLSLEAFPAVVARLFAFLSSFAIAPRVTTDPTFVAMDERRRQALVTAVEQATEGWSEADCEVTAALLDMLWNVAVYERLVAVWGLDAERATRAVTGVVDLLLEAIGDGRRPWLTG